ncbi:peptidase [Chromobacterium phragmitis]|nr:peptidase [Chromobacterium phragmitis]
MNCQARGVGRGKESDVGTLEDILLALSRSEGLPDSAVLDMVAVQRAMHPRASLLYWAVVDYGLPSTEPRLFVFDTLEASSQRFLVAHGRGRDPDANLLSAGMFSNELDSGVSCLGVCRASETYFGSHGLSLWLDGLERGNSNMRRRNLVMHGSAHVSPRYVEEYGILWRSDGSLAVEQQYSVGLINMLQGGSYINCICSR